MNIRPFINAILGFTLCSTVFAASETLPLPKEINRVLYITLDGVRWQDVARQQTQFHKFWNKYAANAVFYGKSLSTTGFQTASFQLVCPLIKVRWQVVYNIVQIIIVA